MNNKRLISVSLMWQSFKQLKIIGIISTIIVAMFAVLPIVATGAFSYLSLRIDGDSIENLIISDVSGFCIPLLLVYMIFTPLISLSAWGFLNHRKTCDFYHALPHTRVCLYFSRLAAVVLWVAVILICNYLLQSISYLVFHMFFHVNLFTLFRYYISFFICALMVAGAVAIACAVTGRKFPNLCLSFMIIVLPRFFISFTVAILSAITEVVSTKYMFPILDSRYNMVINQVVGIFNNSMSDIYLKPQGILYTFVLACIYIGIGCLLFRIRKSETAGKVASGKLLPLFIRILIGFSISVISVGIFVVNAVDYYGDPVSTVLIIGAIIWFFAAITVIVYECIASKSIRGIYRSIPSLLIAYALAIVFGVIVMLSSRQMLRFDPKPEKVQYVQLIEKESHYGLDRNDYFQSCAKSIKIKDKDSIKIFTDALHENIQDILEEREFGYRISDWNEDVLISDDDVPEYLMEDVYQPTITYVVYFKTTFGGTYRKINIKESEVDDVIAKLSQNESFQKAYRDLPEGKKIKISGDALNNLDIDKVAFYNEMMEEAKAIPFSEWYQNLNEAQTLGSVVIEFEKKGTAYTAEIPISQRLPKTYQKMMKLYSQNAYESCTGDMMQIRKQLLSWGNSEEIKLKYEDDMKKFSVISWPSGQYRDADVFASGVLNRSVLIDMANRINRDSCQNTIDFNKPYVEIRMYTYHMTDGRYKSYLMRYFIQTDALENY